VRISRHFTQEIARAVIWRHPFHLAVMFWILYQVLREACPFCISVFLWKGSRNGPAGGISSTIIGTWPDRGGHRDRHAPGSGDGDLLREYTRRAASAGSSVLEPIALRGPLHHLRLFGFVFFVIFLGMGGPSFRRTHAGGNDSPTIICTTEEAVKSIPIPSGR